MRFAPCGTKTARSAFSPYNLRFMQRDATSTAPLWGQRSRKSFWMTTVAFGSLVVPFGIILVRFLAASNHVYLPDDLAVIDLHTRMALRWRQELGPFSRFNWSHPGPTYFYLLTIPYRLLGSGARAEFFGATLINALAAVGIVWVVRRRAGAPPALWAAVFVGFLAIQLSFTGPNSATYSESVLGALVSPWNPTVVIFPLLLVAVLCAAAPARSPLSLLGAMVVGTFVVQTDISTAPLVVALIAVSAVACVVSAVRDRRAQNNQLQNNQLQNNQLQNNQASGQPALSGQALDLVGARVGVTSVSPTPTGTEGFRWTRRGRWWCIVGLVVLVAMWIPPIIEQLTHNPGNLDLIYRFFTSPPVHQSAQARASLTTNVPQDLHTALLSVVSVDGMLVVGPSEVMTLETVLGGTPLHAGIAVATVVVILMIGVAVTVGAVRQRNRFGVGLGALSLVGFVAAVVGVSHLTGLIFGYLVMWEIVVPVMALIGVGVVVLGRPRGAAPPVDAMYGVPGRAAAPVRIGLVILALVVCATLSFRMVELPPLSAASDPKIGKVISLVTPRLDRSDGPVFVGNSGFNSSDLIELEELIGVVNQLDADGYDPKVGSFLEGQLGSGFVSTGHERTQIVLMPWSEQASRLPSYVGRAGNIAVTMTGLSPNAG